MKADVTLHLSKSDAIMLLSLVNVGIAVMKEARSLAYLLEGKKEDFESLAEKVMSAAHAMMDGE